MTAKAKRARNERLARKLVKDAAKNGYDWLDMMYERQDDDVKDMINHLLRRVKRSRPAASEEVPNTSSPFDELRQDGPRFKEPDWSLLNELPVDADTESDKVTVDLGKSEEEMYAWAQGFFAGRQDPPTRTHLRTVRLEHAVGVELSDITVRVEGDAVEISYLASVES